MTAARWSTATSWPMAGKPAEVPRCPTDLRHPTYRPWWSATAYYCAVCCTRLDKGERR